ncbi:endonuclease/exonuclease/phosphatase family protein [Albibacterium sp.]|uniref:endonuclease/exonuclease/phosphatase family protein n=1 Tax=Albibacterium sp. TaxID=2952885 RepID=UPI002B82BCB5|nr:endonuclease/exonuclease/phosphatase family protein [Albibacterium sp.]HUH19813.1 endonuclease/exonuclease/phosphatase family protein [Albibacterium sp.]
MKKIYTALLLSLLISTSAFAQELKVATYNIRYASSNDIGNLWQDRSPYVAALVRFHNFDVFGTQEGLPEQLADLDGLLPTYSRYGKGRDDGKTQGEHSAIYYKKDKFTRLNQGDFWLAENPDIPAKGWDATCCNRIVSWVNLKDNDSGKEFFFFSAHYDHQGQIARKESSKLVLKKIQEIAKGKPVIFVGDLNADHESEPYKILQDSKEIVDTYTLVKEPYHNNGSFNNFKTPASSTVIDHIFVTPGIKVSKWGILTDSYFGKYPSDHFPVISVLSLP